MLDHCPFLSHQGFHVCGKNALKLWKYCMSEMSRSKLRTLGIVSDHRWSLVCALLLAEVRGNLHSIYSMVGMACLSSVAVAVFQVFPWLGRECTGWLGFQLPCQCSENHTFCLKKGVWTWRSFGGSHGQFQGLLPGLLLVLPAWCPLGWLYLPHVPL